MKNLKNCSVRRISSFFLFLMILVSSGVAEASEKKFYFRHLDTRNGLSHNSVHKILQDRYGFIWIATKEGLNRYDGSRFTRIKAANEKRRLGFTTTLIESSDGKLWIGTDNGISIYDPLLETSEWYEMATKEGDIVRGVVYDIAENPEKKIYALTSGDGIFEISPSSGALKRVYDIKGAQKVKPHRLSITPAGKIYIGSIGRGVWYTDDNFKTLHSPVENTNHRLNNETVTAMTLHGSNLYFATSEGSLYSLDTETDRLNEVLKDYGGKPLPVVHDITFNGCKEIYLASNDGIIIYNLKNGEVSLNLRHDVSDWFSLADNSVYSIMFDREGGLWVGTYFGGADHTSPLKTDFEKFYPTSSPKSLKAERVKNIAETTDGMIVVATEDNGISILNPATSEFTGIKETEGMNVSGLMLVGNEIWGAMYTDDVYVFDRNGNKIRKIPLEGRSFGLLRTSSGEIFAASDKGLLVFDKETQKFRKVSPFEDIFIYSIFEDSKGNLWVSTFNNGLYLRNAADRKWTHFQYDEKDDNSLPSNKVFGVQEDDKGNIWVATQNGVGIFDGKKSFDRTMFGLDKLENTVYRMEQDKAGNYWLSTNSGLLSINPKTGNVRSYRTDNGLPTDLFNFGSSLRASDGTLYFGTTEGLVSFNPMEMIVTPPEEITPIITTLYVNGNIEKPGGKDSVLKKSITLSDKIDLHHWQNTLGFRLATLTYGNKGVNSIKYRLKGYEDEWKSAAPENALLIYSHLPSGTYTLEAMAVSESDESLGPPLELKIRIARPAYKSWWAILLYIIGGIVVAIILYIYYRRYSNLARQRDMEKYKHEKETELFDAKLEFFTGVAHEIRTPLALIKAPLSSVMTNTSALHDADMRENLDVIDLNVDRLMLLADQLLDFRRLESGKVQIKKRSEDIKKIVEEVVQRFLPTIESMGRKITVNLPSDEVMAVVDKDAVTKILSNLISNAIKYGKSYIEVSLTSFPSEISITVSNDGKIINQDQRETIFGIFNRLEVDKSGAGIGLAYSRSLAHLHGGTLVMTNDDTKNTFVLTLPHDEAEETEDKEEIISTEYEEMPETSSSNKSVLIVEDNQEMLNFLRKVFIGAGYNVFIAGNGEEGLSIISGNYVDIVISDVMMPGIDGVEFMKRVKEDVRYSHIPVILLTAKTRLEDKLSGLEAGADAYIEKPFSVEYLLATANSLLENRERTRLRYESMPIASPPPNGLNKVDEEFLRKINEIIIGNYENPGFTMEDVIKELGMSRTSFYRKIKGLLNLNPNDYIKLQRLKVAAQLFNEGYTSVSEVCYKVGFSSPGYFTKCFHKQFGVSPKDYIKATPEKDGSSS